MDRKIILIGNPVAGKGAAKKIEKALNVLTGRGFDLQMMLTGRKGDAELFAKRLSASQSLLPDLQPPFLIIAAGGDGTYNEVINGIAGTAIPMAILPIGTTNVLAKELSIPEDVDEAVDIALNGGAHNICLGRITLTQDSSPVAAVTRYFLLMAGIGYDGQTVYGVSKKLKRYSGKGAYMWSGLRALLSWNPGELTFEVDGNICYGYSAIICNASKYAGHFKVTPDAKLAEPRLHAFIMHGRRRRDIVRYVAGIFTKRHLGFKDISYLQAEKIDIKGSAHIQTDGDYLGRSPARIEIVPDALKLVY